MNFDCNTEGFGCNIKDCLIGASNTEMGTLHIPGLLSLVEDDYAYCVSLTQITTVGKTLELFLN